MLRGQVGRCRVAFVISRSTSQLLGAAPRSCPRGAAVRSTALHREVAAAGRDEAGNRAERFTCPPKPRSGEGGSPRVRAARSVTRESATPVHAAMAGVRIGYYSRRRRQGTSRSETSGVRSGRRMADTATPLVMRHQSAGSGCGCGTPVRSSSGSTARKTAGVDAKTIAS